MCSREECSKWRYLAMKDPSLVEDDWECKDNPDQRFRVEQLSSGGTRG